MSYSARIIEAITELKERGEGSSSIAIDNVLEKASTSVAYFIIASFVSFMFMKPILTYLALHLLYSANATVRCHKSCVKEECKPRVTAARP